LRIDKYKESLSEFIDSDINEIQLHGPEIDVTRTCADLRNATPRVLNLQHRSATAQLEMITPLDPSTPIFEPMGIVIVSTAKPRPLPTPPREISSSELMHHILSIGKLFPAYPPDDLLVLFGGDRGPAAATRAKSTKLAMWMEESIVTRMGRFLQTLARDLTGKAPESGRWENQEAVLEFRRKQAAAKRFLQIIVASCSIFIGVLGGSLSNLLHRPDLDYSMSFIKLGRDIPEEKGRPRGLMHDKILLLHRTESLVSVTEPSTDTKIAFPVTRIVSTVPFFEGFEEDLFMHAEFLLSSTKFQALIATETLPDWELHLPAFLRRMPVVASAWFS
jgi:hypothetical protein